MFQRILIVLWLFSFKWQSLMICDSQSQLSVSIYESQVVMGKSGISELECPPQADAQLVLVVQWHCQGALGISTAWPWLRERIPNHMFKTKAITFLLTSLWIGLLKGRGEVFLIGLCSEQQLGWDRFWPCSPQPLDLPCNNPRHLHGREGG